MERHDFQSNGLKLSYLDTGGNGKPLIALHAHWMEATTFIPFANFLGSEWRVIALDQRGHGHSDHAQTYTRDDYLNDLLALFSHLKLLDAVLLGNSLGGVNAYQFAARYPDRVRAMIIEEIGAKVSVDVNFVLNWKGTFTNREELANRVGPRLYPYLADSFRTGPRGWHLAFDPRDMIKSQASINGDHWQDWLKSGCPTLLVRGQNSRLTTEEEFSQMALRRANTQFVTLKGGHVVHYDIPKEFVDVLRTFLQELPEKREM